MMVRLDMTALKTLVRGVGVAALVLALGALLAPVTHADDATVTKFEDDKGHAAYKGFEISGKYILTLENVRVEGSAVYWSQVAQSWLITKEGAPRALVIGRNTRGVESVASKFVLMREEGSRFISEKGELLKHPNFTVSGDSLQIFIEKKTYRLIPNPPLLGWLTRNDLLQHTPEYATQSKEYTPDPELVKRLTKAAKERGETTINIYFGSWCTACSRVLGRILRIEEMLQADGLNVTFKYYGFPEGRRQYRRDREWRNNRIKLLPTGVVRTNTRAGRIEGLDGWSRPEKALLDRLGA